MTTSHEGARPGHTTRRQHAGETPFGKLLLSRSILDLHTLSMAIDHAEQQQVPLADAIRPFEAEVLLSRVSATFRRLDRAAA